MQLTINDYQNLDSLTTYVPSSDLNIYGVNVIEINGTKFVNEEIVELLLEFANQAIEVFNGYSNYIGDLDRLSREINHKLK